MIITPGPDSSELVEGGAGHAWTAEQLRAIERRDGDLLLDAGAGSGKTSVLVERFVRAVLEDGIAVPSILTITFTEKAAAELRDRIRQRLRELGAAAAARETEGAFISTIHGFCARVLRVHALSAGLDPGFAVLDRHQSEPLAAAAFDHAIEELARGETGAVELIAAYGAGPLRAAILAVYAQLRSSGQSEPRLPDVQAPLDREAPAALVRAAEVLAGELGAIAAPSARVSEALARVWRAGELVARADLWPGELERVRLPGRNGAALSTDACVAYSEALTRFHAVCAARAAAPVRDMLAKLLAIYGARYAGSKRELSGLDFEDLELLTRSLLAHNGALRERYATRFERIMVDEFQDTNRVQLELIESIARGNLFTVGDAQQSIYGFRHADVELFERRGARLAQAGERETLQTNFRSRPEILAALNRAFGTELGDRFKPLRPGLEPAAGEAPEAGGPRVELLIVDKGADWDLEGLASPWRLAEAAALADRVGELVEGGATAGEIVVLTRATTDMRAYERALERRGLPTYVIGGRGYWSHPQVVDLVAYLRALANPRDEESLFTILASPLVGASLDALVVLAAGARACGRDPWWALREPREELAPCAPADRERLTAFASWFSDERACSARCAVEELIDRALRTTGYDLAMLAMPGGQRRLANVRKLMRLGREHESEHGPDLRGFLEAVAEREAGRGADSRESEAPVEGEALDAVRLMTIHRAKGLEFKIVCVADLGRSPRRAVELLRVDRDGRIGIRLARPGAGGRVPALAYQDIGFEQQRAEEAEERRLFYVAMTRAQERLVLSGAAKLEGWTAGGATGGGPIAWIAPALIPELGERVAEGGGVIERDGIRIALRIPEPGPVSGGAAAPPAPAAVPQPAAVLPPAPRAAPVAPVASLSYSTLGEYARCGYRFYAERVLGLPPGTELGAPGPTSGRPALGSRREPSGALGAADRGILIHALLEHLNFRRPATPAQEDILAAAAAAGISPPSPPEVQELAALVGQFAATELCARLGAAAEVRREARFAFLLSGLLVTGALDVLARGPGRRALVVDYKSDRLDVAEPAAIVQRSYGTQRLIYALAALRAGADAVEVSHCFLERPSEPVTASFDTGQTPELERELERLAGGVRRREFAVSPAPHRALCSGCPAEGGLCSWPTAQTRRESPDQLF